MADEGDGSIGGLGDGGREGRQSKQVIRLLGSNFTSTSPHLTPTQQLLADYSINPLLTHFLSSIYD